MIGYQETYIQYSYFSLSQCHTLNSQNIHNKKKRKQILTLNQNYIHSAHLNFSLSLNFDDFILNSFFYFIFFILLCLSLVRFYVCFSLSLSILLHTFSYSHFHTRNILHDQEPTQFYLQSLQKDSSFFIINWLRSVLLVIIFEICFNLIYFSFFFFLILFSSFRQLMVVESECSVWIV